MQLGIFARTFRGTDPEGVLDQVARAGYDCAQFNLACCGLPSMPDQLDEEVAASIAAASKRTSVGIAALSGTYNMIHPDPAIRAQGLDRLGVLLSRARAMGTRLVTVCTGTRDAEDQWRYHPDNDTPEAWRDLLAEMGKAVDRAESFGVDLGIEPELANVVSSADRAARLLNEIASPRLRIVLDPANLSGVADDAQRDTVVARAVDRLAAWIALAHLKDRRRDGGVAAAGAGVVDFDGFLSRLHQVGFDGPVVTHGLTADEAPAVAAFLRPKLH